MPRTIRLAVTLVVLASCFRFGRPAPLVAQNIDSSMSVSTAVKPHGGALVQAQASKVAYVVFRVKNNGRARNAYQLECLSVGAIRTCGVLGATTISLAPGEERRIVTSYLAGEAGAGRVELLVNDGNGNTRGDYGVSIIQAPAIPYRSNPELDSGADDFLAPWNSEADEARSILSGQRGSDFELNPAILNPRLEVYPASGTFASETVDILVVSCNPENHAFAHQSHVVTNNGRKVDTELALELLEGTQCQHAPGTSGVASIATVALDIGHEVVTAEITGPAAPRPASLAAASATYFRMTQVAPTVSVNRFNPGPRFDRGACVSASAGLDATFQCGDLTLAHSMPTYRSNDRDRNLALLYNSRTSYPVEHIMAEISLAAGATVPNQLETELILTGPTGATYTWTHTYSKHGLQAGAVFPNSRFLSLPVNADSLGLATGVYPYTLEVTNVYTGNALSTTVSGELIVIARQNSAYGNGWSVLGERRLYPATINSVSKLLMTDGDGSGLVFTAVNDTQWVAPPGLGYQDTITKSTFSHGTYVSGNYYRLKTLGRLSYYFSLGQNGPAQKHLRYVVDAADNTAAYTWTSDKTGLLTIGVAPRADSLLYRFHYSSAKLDSITDPAGRILQVGRSGNLVTWLQDPGHESTTRVQFEYHTDDRLKKRTNRRGYATSYTYGSTLEAMLPDSQRFKYTPIQLRALPVGSIDTMVSTLDARIKLDGPRTSVGDTAVFWPNRYGSPIESVDPAGAHQWLTYASGQDALPTEWKHTDGRKIEIVRDGFGRLTSVVQTTWLTACTDNQWSLCTTPGVVRTTGPDTTTYEYADADAPASPSRVRAKRDAWKVVPAPSVEWDTVRATYNSAGLPDTIWDAAGRRTILTYTNGQLTRAKAVAVDMWQNGSIVTDSQVTVMQYSTDMQRNLISTTSPGNLTSTLRLDAVGRVIGTVNAAGDSARTSYNLRGLVDKVVRFEVLPGN